MNANLSLRSVLDSLSMKELKTLAEAQNIDLKPKISEIPVVKLRGERHFIEDKLMEIIGFTVEDIDTILGTSFATSGTRKAKTVDAQEDKRVEGEADFKLVLLKQFAGEGKIQAILFDLNLSVSGSMDTQIERIMDSGRVDVPDIIKLLDESVLAEICQYLGLDAQGAKEDLKARILQNQGFAVEAS